MNPLFQALTGISTPFRGMNGQTPVQMGGGPFNAVQSAMQQAQQIANAVRNPQGLVQRFFPDAPQEVQGDPEQLIGWLQQTGRVSPQLVQTARQMMGR